MIDFSLLASTPFRNPTAFRDMAGILAIAHQDIAETIERQTNTPVTLSPLGDGRPGDQHWQFALQQALNSECLALGITQPSDLSDFNLTDEAEFYSFTFLLGNEMNGLDSAQGSRDG